MDMQSLIIMERLMLVIYNEIVLIEQHLTGEVTTDDILDRIFGSFCVGK